MKCLVDGCTNTDEQGNGFFMNIYLISGQVKLHWICVPCSYTLNGGIGIEKNSQLYRNVINHSKLKGE